MSIIPENMNFKVFTDNYFSSLPLLLEMNKKGFQMVGTVKLDRVPGIKNVLVSDKDLKARGKSEFEEYEGKLGDDSSVRVCRWVDNNMVTLIYTMGSAQPEGELLRWVKTAPNVNQERVAVKCPNVVKLYNKAMGGVDKMDSLIGFHRIFFKTKKWYRRIFWHLVDLC